MNSYMKPVKLGIIKKLFLEEQLVVIQCHGALTPFCEQAIPIFSFPVDG